VVGDVAAAGDLADPVDGEVVHGGGDAVGLLEDAGAGDGQLLEGVVVEPRQV
jgi:hypothetical protein